MLKKPIILSDYACNLSGSGETVKKRYSDKAQRIGYDPFYAKEAKKLTTFPKVTMVDLCSYFIFQTSFYSDKEVKAYKSLEAYKRYEKGWLQKIECFVALEDSIVAIGKVKHSQRLNAAALDAWVHLKEDGCIISAHCTCMAGLAEVCSHVATIVFALVHKAEEEAVACTSSLSKWPVPSLKNVPMARINEMSWGRQTRAFGTAKELTTVPQLTGGEISSLLQTIENETGITPALSYITEPFCNRLADAQKRTTNIDLGHLFTEELLDFPLHLLKEFAQGVDISLDPTDAREIEKKSRGQDGETWHRYRRGRITASNFKSTCTSSTENPAISTIRNICYAGQFKFSTAATSYGKELEEASLRDYCSYMKMKHTGFSIRKSGLIIRPAYPMFGASPDSIVSCSCCGEGSVETKCPYKMRDSNIAEFCAMKNVCLESDGNDVKLKTNHAYYYQVQLQIFVGQFKYVDFVVWSKKDMFVQRIFEDKEFIEANVRKAKVYHERVVLPELLGKVFTRNRPMPI